MTRDYSTDPPYELTAWVLLATDGLVAPARERIKQEIMAHYADAVALHLASGLPQDAAEDRALLELGDIRTAAKAFRKRYLTEEDLTWLREFEGGYRQPRWRKYLVMLGVVSGSGLLCWTFVFLPWVRPRMGPGAFSVIRLCVGAIWLVLPIYFLTLGRSYHLVTHNPSGPEMWRKLLRLSLLQSGMYNMFCAGFASFQTLRLLHSPVFINVGIFVLAALSPLAARRFRLWWKLHYEQIAGAKNIVA